MSDLTQLLIDQKNLLLDTARPDAKVESRLEEYRERQAKIRDLLKAAKIEDKLAFYDLLQWADHWNSGSLPTYKWRRRYIENQFQTMLACAAQASASPPHTRSNPQNQPEVVSGASVGQYFSCFISYSSKDDEFARHLHKRLKQADVDVWFAPEDTQSGKKLHEQIGEAINDLDRLLIVLSPSSLKSEWVMTELRRARKLESMTGKRKLFPLRLMDFDTLREWECFDADHGQDLAIEVRQYFIPDFTNWRNPHAFEMSFTRLLKDLSTQADLSAHP